MSDDEHELERPNEWDRVIYCPEKDESHSFEADMGWEYCPFCGAELV